MQINPEQCPATLLVHLTAHKYNSCTLPSLCTGCCSLHSAEQRLRVSVLPLSVQLSLTGGTEHVQSSGPVERPQPPEVWGRDWAAPQQSWVLCWESSFLSWYCKWTTEMIPHTSKPEFPLAVENYLKITLKILLLSSKVDKADIRDVREDTSLFPVEMLFVPSKHQSYYNKQFHANRRYLWAKRHSWEWNYEHRFLFLK